MPCSCQRPIAGVAVDTMTLIGGGQLDRGAKIAYAQNVESWRN